MAKANKKISVLRQLLKEASAIDIENAEKEAMLAQAQADKAIADLEKANAETELQNLADKAPEHQTCACIEGEDKDADKTVNEADTDEAFVRIYDFSTFKIASAEIIKQMGDYGFVVLKDKTSLYGLLFKLESEAAKKTYVGHLYSYPQDEGRISGGVSFAAADDKFGIEAWNQKGKVL